MTDLLLHYLSYQNPQLIHGGLVAPRMVIEISSAKIVRWSKEELIAIELCDGAGFCLGQEETPVSNKTQNNHSPGVKKETSINFSDVSLLMHRSHQGNSSTKRQQQ
uniref:Uncharacterized protein n=1 Tax=Steinernema glaseri TaxID=37863 RepID=A0A1I8AKD8_9BILA